MPAKPLRLSVKAVILDPAGRCLVLRRSAASRNNAGRWDFPGGKLDPGEAFDEALRREIREETGLEAELERALGVTETELPAFRVIALILQGRLAPGAPGDVTLSAEHDAFQWIEPRRLAGLDMVEHYRQFAARQFGG